MELVAQCKPPEQEICSGQELTLSALEHESSVEEQENVVVLGDTSPENVIVCGLVVKPSAWEECFFFVDH
jgi:hypothetical protein